MKFLRWKVGKNGIKVEHRGVEAQDLTIARFGRCCLGFPWSDAIL